MEYAKLSVELIFSPLGIVTILMCVGILLSILKKKSPAGHRVLIYATLLFLIFLFSPLSQYLIWNLEKGYPPLLAPPTNGQIARIVILAGYAEDNSGIPITSNISSQTLGNISEGLRLYRLIPKSKLIISGGVLKKGDRAVARYMADFLQQMGVPGKDLIVEGKSQNTYENLREVRQILGADPFILVAAGCDMRRAMGVARKLRMNPIPSPSNIWTLQKFEGTRNTSSGIFASVRKWTHVSLDNLSRLQWAYHEYAGYLWYRMLGYI
ncbi:MAG: YdcF family protein [Acidobacteria bacterium]|nr:YdcF family protein [Acidobacteriota bacterium]